MIAPRYLYKTSPIIKATSQVIKEHHVYVVAKGLLWIYQPKSVPWTFWNKVNCSQSTFYFGSSISIQFQFHSMKLFASWLYCAKCACHIETAQPSVRTWEIFRLIGQTVFSYENVYAKLRDLFLETCQIPWSYFIFFICLSFTTSCLRASVMYHVSFPQNFLGEAHPFSLLKYAQAFNSTILFNLYKWRCTLLIKIDDNQSDIFLPDFLLNTSLCETQGLQSSSYTFQYNLFVETIVKIFSCQLNWAY